jgi:hypothetical protein
MFKAQPSFWHMLLPALGLHGLLLAYPIETKGDLDAVIPKSGKPVRVIALPSVRPSPKIKKSAVRQSVNVSSKVRRASSPALRRAVVPNIATAQSKVAIPESKPNPFIREPQPFPKSTPSAPPTPLSTPTNEFQMDGATVGCTGSAAQDCFAVTESNGRLVASQIEANLRKKGYDLSSLDLEEENGMKVYQLSKRGPLKPEQPEDYLHIFWDENGTVYFRNPKVLSYKELAVKARQ